MYFAQHGEDKWLNENKGRLGLRSHGVFVEVGADDGLSNSNTAWLERECGWTGLCIEPDPRLSNMLRRNRSCRIDTRAIGAHSGIFPMHLWGPGLAGFLRTEGDRIHVETVTLGTVLVDQQIGGQIDVLSIDTEGTELDVWNSFDHSLWEPKLVFVEWDTIGLPDRRDEIVSIFIASGYQLETTLGANLVFVRVQC